MIPTFKLKEDKNQATVREAVTEGKMPGTLITPAITVATIAVTWVR